MPPFKVYEPRFRQEIERWWRGELHPELLKETPRRRIWRVPTGVAPLIVKRFPRSLWQDRAAKEARLLRALHEASIPAPRLVATARDSSGAYIVTEEITEAVTLKERLSKDITIDRALLLRLADLTRKMHDRGFDHLDFHAGNVFVRGDELIVMDVHRARRVSRLPRSRRLSGAAFLAMSFAAFPPITEIFRFFRRYGFESREELISAYETLIRLRTKFYRRRQKRCLREGTQFGILKGMYFRKGADLGAVRQMCNSKGLTPVKGTLSRSEDGLFIKRTRRGKALRIWENAQGLSVRGIATPRLDACTSSWVVGEWVTSRELYHYIREQFGKMSRAERDAFLFRLAREVRRMHQLGVYHHDLKSSNVLVSDKNIVFIDLDRVSFYRNVREHDRRFNLAQLNASVTPPLTRADRLRFLKFYINRDLKAWRQRKEWAAKIMELTRARHHQWP